MDGMWAQLSLLGFSKGEIGNVLKNSRAVEPLVEFILTTYLWGQMGKLLNTGLRYQLTSFFFPFLYKQHSPMTLSFNNREENTL